MLQFPEIEEHPLKNVLKERGINQIRVARALGVSLASLSQFLNGYRTAPPEIQDKLTSIQNDLEGFHRG